jgi:flagellin-like hook-associated protein FlgL
LNEEINALVDEFNRIVNTTEYNERLLLDGSTSTLSIQAGYGTAAIVPFDLAEELARISGTGTFEERVSYDTGEGPRAVAVEDLNNDGMLDLVVANAYVGDDGNTIGVFLGNGDGTFNDPTYYATGTYPTSLAIGDLNGDGAADIVSGDADDDKVSVFLGVGNGTFGVRTSHDAGDAPRSVTLGDINGDGDLDLISTSLYDHKINVFIGAGNGTFAARESYSSGEWPISLQLGDVNQDGYLDIVAADYHDAAGGNSISIFLANGDGTFNDRISFESDTPTSLSMGDLNGDGFLDIVTTNYDPETASVYLGNGNGTFGARTSYATSTTPYSITLGDLNGDGILDMLTSNPWANDINLFLGKGNGTFEARTTLVTTGAPIFSALADLNQDGALDIVTSQALANTFSVSLATTKSVSTIPYLNITTGSGALEALDVLDQTSERVELEAGSIAAAQSRLDSTLNIVSVMRDNYSAAYGRVVDADMANDLAETVRLQMLQESGVALLAQGNLQPKLVTRLLDLTFADDDD